MARRKEKTLLLRRVANNIGGRRAYRRANGERWRRELNGSEDPRIQRVVIPCVERDAT